MNIRQYILPIILTAFTFIGVRYIINRWLHPADSDNVEVSFVAPKKVCELPLQTTIDVPPIQVGTDVLTTVTTKWAELEFSDNGAILHRLSFINGLTSATKADPITTIVPPLENDYRTATFMVARTGQTPVRYKLTERRQQDTSTVLVYQSLSSSVITKIFTIYHDKHQIDLTVSASEVTPQDPIRIFYPAPYLTKISHQDIPTTLVVDVQGTVTKIGENELPEDRGWFSPRIFGGVDRYFVHAMVANPHNIVKRAYYTKPQEHLVAILEMYGAEQEQTYTTSFYMGPKQERTMAAVSETLYSFVDQSGYFAPITSPLLKLLNWLKAMTGSYGLAIILVTFLLKLLLLPFTLQRPQDIKQRMEMQKKLQYIQQRYKDDPEALRREREELIAKQGLAGLGGCLPMLLQVPFFLALSRVLNYSVELYRASWLWIPDLSAHDPYYILPGLVTTAILLQALVTPTDPQQRFPMIAMGFIFGAFSASFSAGLALYLFVSTLLGVLQTMITPFIARYI